MPLIDITYVLFTDLVLKEPFAAEAFARRKVNVTTSTPMPLGTVVFRAKVADQEAPYAVMTDAATQAVEANEFAVIFGDHYKYQDVVQPAASGPTNALAFVRGEVMFKDLQILKANNIVRDSAGHVALKALLENQGMLMVETLEATTPVV